MLKLSTIIATAFILFVPTITIGQVTDSDAKVENDLGVFVRQVVIRVAARDSKNWESAVRALADAAKKAKTEDHNWLLYHGGQSEYWLILFGDDIQSVPTEMSFDNEFRGTANEKSYQDALEKLLQTEFEVTRDIVCQQDPEWSTVESMSTATHPKARVVDYWIRPCFESEFDSVQKQYVALLKEIKYPYPVESFRARFGGPRVHQVVTFPDNWSSFHGANDLAKLAKSAGKELELSEIRTQREKFILRATHHDIDFIKSMSYSPPSDE